MPRRFRWFSPLVPIGLALALTLPFFPWGAGGLLAAPGRNGAAPRASHAGRTLVVDPNGRDTTGDGSAGRPWKTIQKAASQVQPGDLSQGGDGVISGALVEDNVIWENGAGGGSGINMDGVTDSIVRNNLIYRSHASGISMYQIDGGVCSQRNQVLNNTISLASDGRWAVNIPNDGCVDNKVFNNILYTSHSYRGSINLVPGSFSGFASDDNVVMDRFTTDGGDSRLILAGWRGLGFDTHSRIATPAQLFVDPSGDFHLKTGSPAIDAGTTLASVGDDLDGNPRPRGNAFDAGAYESGGTAPANTPTATATATRTPTRTPTTVPTATATRTP